MDFTPKQRCGKLVALFLACAQVINAAPSYIQPRAVNPPTALPQKATANDLRWQPSLDFDTDGCYNVPAIDKDGNIVQGLPHDVSQCLIHVVGLLTRELVVCWPFVRLS